MLKFEQCKGWWVDVFKNILIYYATFLKFETYLMSIEYQKDF
jgi:hypothetical protein